jgi:hypothetical protein
MAGTITRANQGAESRAIILDQIKLFARFGGDLNDEEAIARFVIRSGKRSPSTVYKWLPVVLASFRDASRYIAGQAILPERPSSIQPETHSEIVPAAPVASIDPVVSVASAATSPGKPGQSHSLALPPTAERSSSEQTCRQRPAEPCDMASLRWSARRHRVFEHPARRPRHHPVVDVSER